MPGRDAAERAQLLRIAVLFGGPALIIGAFTIFFVASRLKASPGVLLACLVLLLPATWGLILLVESATYRAAQGVVTTLHAGHARAPLQGFSRQEALVAQGRPDEAVTAYRQRLMESPGDVRAMIALARLLGGPLADAEGAESLYQRARAERPGPHWERVITDDLIDLYGRMGMDGKWRTELARFADLHRGTQAGSAARARLDRLKLDPPQEG
jgi:hypothetical protein